MVNLTKPTMASKTTTLGVTRSGRRGTGRRCAIAGALSNVFLQGWQHRGSWKVISPATWETIGKGLTDDEAIQLVKDRRRQGYGCHDAWTVEELRLVA